MHGADGDGVLSRFRRTPEEDGAPPAAAAALAGRSMSNNEEPFGGRYTMKRTSPLVRAHPSRCSFASSRRSDLDPAGLGPCSRPKAPVFDCFSLRRGRASRREGPKQWITPRKGL